MDEKKHYDKNLYSCTGVVHTDPKLEKIDSDDSRQYCRFVLHVMDGTHRNSFMVFAWNGVHEHEQYATYCSTYLKKGSRVALEGKIQIVFHSDKTYVNLVVRDVPLILQNQPQPLQTEFPFQVQPESTSEPQRPESRPESKMKTDEPVEIQPIFPTKNPNNDSIEPDFDAIRTTKRFRLAQ